MEALFRNLISGQSRGVGAAVARAMLGAVAVPYRIAVTARNRRFDSGTRQSERVGVPVLSVGNITLGGTGKTPMVEFVCRRLTERGLRPVILSRGYRGGHAGNDEAKLLEANLPDVPHLQDRDRVAIAREAIERFAPDVLVLDDGFQHRRLARDLDIVLIDCSEPFGYGRVFPAGTLREPLEGLRRAGMIMLTRADTRSEPELRQIEDTIISVAGPKPIVRAEFRPTRVITSAGPSAPSSVLAGRTVAAFCGIGNPAAFWRTLRGLGCEVIETKTFSDHHHYEVRDIRELEAWLGDIDVEAVVTTQKDLVKIPAKRLAGRPLLAVRIEAAVTDPAGHIDRAIDRILSEGVARRWAA